MNIKRNLLLVRTLDIRVPDILDSTTEGSTRFFCGEDIAINYLVHGSEIFIASANFGMKTSMQLTWNKTAKWTATFGDLKYNGRYWQLPPHVREVADWLLDQINTDYKKQKILSALSLATKEVRAGPGRRKLKRHSKNDICV